MAVWLFKACDGLGSVGTGGVAVGVASVETEPGAMDSDVMTKVEARPLRGDATGGIAKVSVGAEALEEGVDTVPSLTETLADVEILAVLDAAENEPPERSELRNCGLVIEKLVRGWAIVVFTMPLGNGLTRNGFPTVRGVDSAGEGRNKVGSIWSSRMPAGGDGIDWDGAASSSPNGPRGELRGST
jgi:hypothetical protein